MQFLSPFNVLKWLTALLILKVTVSVVMIYDGYLPPDFSMTFLHSRQDYFWSSSSWSSYIDLVSEPPILIVGLIVLNDRFRMRFPEYCSVREIIKHQHILQPRPHQLHKFLMRGVRQVDIPTFFIFECHHETVREAGRFVLDADIGAVFKLHDRVDLPGQ